MVSWSHLKDYGPGNKRRYRYFLVIIDTCSKYGWTVPLKNRNAQTIKDSSGKILISSNRKLKLIETDRGKKQHKNIFQNFLNNNNIKHYSRKTSAGVVLQKDLIKLWEIFLENLFLNQELVIGLIFYPKKTEQYNNRIHSSTTLAPIQASLKKNEGFFYNNSLDKRKNISPKFQVNDLVRTADLRKTFSKSDTTNWSF